MKTVTREFVRELIDFAPTEEAKSRGYAATQLDGTVAAFNMLARNRCAYLADEVGMGKTYVALGVMSLVRYFEPTARIIVIAPRENIQRKWVKELQNFLRDNWRVAGNHVKSLQGGPAWEPVLCDSLVDFVHEALLNADRDFFLRMTSFSLALKQPENRRRLRRMLREHVPWVDTPALSARDANGFRKAFGCALNAVVPEADLLVIDEGHNLKHGFGDKGSIRNHIMGLAFGHPSGASDEFPHYGHRVKRVLLLSATPFEEEYAAIQRQFEVFGFGAVTLRDTVGDGQHSMKGLLDPNGSDAAKREVVSRLMIRRVSGLEINGRFHTKNLYRREWRRGGYECHDDPMEITDPKQRLVMALMQKKVAEVLQNEKFNNHFQIGMLSSFESFLQTVTTAARRKPETDGSELEEQEDPERVFDGDQSKNERERRGIDTGAIARVVESYREQFDTSLPHPKLDRTAAALSSAFETGEKTLVFVRRIATVDELGARLDRVFDRWIRRRMEEALPELGAQITALFQRYHAERSRRPEDQLEDVPGEDEEFEELAEQRDFLEEEDEGSAETFFSWFFRGKGPPKTLSGAAFQKNRLQATSSAYSTLFEDDHVAWLLGRPANVPAALAGHLGRPLAEVRVELRRRAYGHFRARSKQKEGYPRLYVYEAYQAAALELLEEHGGELGDHAKIVLRQRHGVMAAPAQPTEGFPGPEESIGAVTFITELVQRPALRKRLWPDPAGLEFEERFRRREQRRELLSGMARLGAAYIDLYLLAIRAVGSFQLRQETEVERPDRRLARDYVELLETQAEQPGFHAFYELSRAAEAFELLLAVNFPEVPSAPLHELAAIYGTTLQRQMPVGRMSGSVNKRLVRQFRMPGFPLVLATTDVLQEGEDLHTFCRRVVHYGITWTPSAMEQRTGRIDRIGSLVQRQLDGARREVLPGEFIQVFYPHLCDTVEVLQVRRVLRRLNRFLRLIHQHDAEEGDRTSSIDVTRAFLEDLDDIAPLAGPLESAFPVGEQWLQGELKAGDVRRPDVAALLGHLDALWGQLVDAYRVDPDRTSSQRVRSGVAALCKGRILRKGDAEEQARILQPFRVELRSKAAGDATLLRCRSDVGKLDLRDPDVLDKLYELQRDLGRVKVCVEPEGNQKLDRVTIDGAILFHPETTQFEEIVTMVERVARSACEARQAFLDEGS